MYNDEYDENIDGKPLSNDYAEDIDGKPCRTLTNN